MRKGRLSPAAFVADRHGCFLGLSTIMNMLIVCCIDPEINIDAATVQAFEDNRNDKIAEEKRLAKRARAVRIRKKYYAI